MTNRTVTFLAMYGHKPKIGETVIDMDSGRVGILTPGFIMTLSRCRHRILKGSRIASLTLLNRMADAREHCVTRCRQAIERFNRQQTSFDKLITEHIFDSTATYGNLRYWIGTQAFTLPFAISKKVSIKWIYQRLLNCTMKDANTDVGSCSKGT